MIVTLHMKSVSIPFFEMLSCKSSRSGWLNIPKGLTQLLPCLLRQILWYLSPVQISSCPRVSKQVMVRYVCHFVAKLQCVFIPRTHETISRPADLAGTTVSSRLLQDSHVFVFLKEYKHWSITWCFNCLQYLGMIYLTQTKRSTKF